MITKTEALRVLDDRGHLHTEAGNDLGPVVRVFLDGYTDWPSFATVAITPASTRET